MPAVVYGQVCPACNSAHDLCHSDADEIDPLDLFVYTCPTTGKSTHLTGRPCLVEPDCPTNSVPLRRVT
jgi:hypothetical protein